MNSLGNSIDALIENIQVSEHHAENQRKLLKNREIEIKKINAELSSIQEEREKINEEVKGMLLEADEKEALLMSLEKEINILSNIHTDLKQLYDKEEKILSEKQQNVWKDRESFCNLYHKISEDVGSMGTNWLRKPDIWLNATTNVAEMEKEEHNLLASIKKLEDDIRITKKAVSEAELKLTEVKLAKEKLSRDPDFGEEFIQLQMRLKQVQSEIGNLENQLEHKKEQQQGHQLLNRKWKQQRLNLIPLSDNSTTFRLTQREDHLEISTNEKLLKKKVTNRNQGEDGRSNLNIKQYDSLKRPIASAPPAEIENNLQENVFPPKSKQHCKFVPKIQSSIGKKYLSRSNSWVQLQNELTALLNKDTTK